MSEYKCPSCDINDANEPHECPYKSEINGNNDLCRCCDDCKDQCSMNR